MNLTVVMITHQMEVVRDACDYVAVLNGGEVCEIGKVSDVFSNPKSDVTKDFLAHLSSNVISSQSENPEQKSEIIRWSKNQGKYTLYFRGESTGEPVISSVCKKFDVEVNILAGGLQSLSGNEKVGAMAVDISGSKDEVQKSLEYLKSLGIVVEKI